MKPILVFDVPTPKEQDSWRSYGAIQTPAAAREEAVRIEKELGEKATVVATGGYGSIFAKETVIFKAVNPDITLIGLRMIYQMNKV